jgi:hypothetical protein
MDCGTKREGGKVLLLIIETCKRKLAGFFFNQFFIEQSNAFYLTQVWPVTTNCYHATYRGSM